MFEVMPYLCCLNQILSSASLRQLSAIVEAILCCRGRVTMLGLSRWSETGGSYRTIQRFYSSKICWLRVNCKFFFSHQWKKDGVYIMAGDESTVTKSGKETHGLGRFFSSIYSRAVKGLGFFSLCLIEVNSKSASPLLMEQLDPKMKRDTKVKNDKKKGKKGKRGRPKGSKNKNQREVELTPYLLWIQGHIKKVLGMIGERIKIVYFVYDGAFGNNPCLQMVKGCGVSLISKLQCKSALWFAFKGEREGRGKKPKYGKKLDYQQIPLIYLVKSFVENGVEEKIYQMTLWHKNFPDRLNIVVIQRIRTSDNKIGQIILFSDDPDLAWDKMILYYRLRFQIEFTFRDAKQFWGLEDFMNVKEQTVENAANLSMFMVNLSRTLMNEDDTMVTPSVIDLKARFQAGFYIKKIVKINPQIQGVISLKKLQRATADIGCIHPKKIAA